MAVKIFCSYADKDEQLLKELKEHLRPLIKSGLIEWWHDRNISVGTEWQSAVDTHLNKAEIILLLISQYFMDSDYAYTLEAARALERHEHGKARVIPILLRPIYYGGSPFAKLQALPIDAPPVTNWRNRNEAFAKIAKDLQTSLKAKEWLKEGDALNNLKRYEEALTAYEQAIRLDPNYAHAYNNMGVALDDFKRYEEALTAYEQAIRLNPNDAVTYNNMGVALDNLERYKEALTAYEQAIRLNPNYAHAYNNMGVALSNLERYKEAFTAYEQAIRLGPNYAQAHYNMGVALSILGRYKEALTAYEQAIRLDPNHAQAYYSMSVTFKRLGRKDEARQADARARQLIGYEG